MQKGRITQQDEGDIGPERGVTYAVALYDREGRLVRSESGLSSNRWVWASTDAALDAGSKGDRITVEIRAERQGLISWQPQRRELDRAGYGLRWGQWWG